jgi:hypothetical protein
MVVNFVSRFLKETHPYMTPVPLRVRAEEVRMALEGRYTLRNEGRDRFWFGHLRNTLFKATKIVA